MPKKESKIGMAEAEAALIQCHGIISDSADLLHVARTAMYWRVKHSPRLQEVARQAREAVLDKAEVNIYNRVLKGDLKVSQWMLTRIGRDRGYGRVEEMRHTGPDGGAVRLSTVVKQELDAGCISDIIGILADAGVLPTGVVEAIEALPDSPADGVHPAPTDA